MHDRRSIKPSILVTGCAGFIGARTAELFLADGQSVVGIEDLNDYYDVRLKQHRLQRLESHPAFCLRQINLESA